MIDIDDVYKNLSFRRIILKVKDIDINIYQCYICIYRGTLK